MSAVHTAARAAGIATILVAALASAQQVSGPPEGLAAEYFTGLDAASAPTMARLDSRPATQQLLDAWKGPPPPLFHAAWRGALVALREGNYTFTTVSDDGSHVYIDGRLVVDNGGAHPPIPSSGSVHLARGVHSLFVDFDQRGEGFALEFLWARNGATPVAVPSWALAPRPVSFARFVVAVLLRRALASTEWVWVCSLVLLAAVGSWRLTAPLRHIVVTWCRATRALAWVLAGSLVLNATGLWWGLPRSQWMPDELTPDTVFWALRAHFSHGWFDRYPPAQFYVLTALYSPILLLQNLGRIEVMDPLHSVPLLALGRLVNVALGAGIVLGAYACGARAFGRRAGLGSAAAMALVAPFVYYAKTANVDVSYLFWVAGSMLFYLRALETLTFTDFLGFGLCATLAVCTKDQAYGLYLAVPLVLGHRICAARGSGWAVTRARAGRLVLAGLASVLLFAACHNLLFNTAGFVAHVRLLAGPASESYRLFEPTAAGRWHLLQLSAHLLRAAWGWPLTIAVGIGVVIALARRERRYTAVILVVPVLTYYAGFLDVILYNYDRFMLPVCFVLAPFAGLACDRWLAASTRAGWSRIGAASLALVFAYSALYSATVDALMLGDSRYAVEPWLTAHVGKDDVVGSCFDPMYLPNLEDYRRTNVCSIDELDQAQPAWFVLNVDYARAAEPGSAGADFFAKLRAGALGYRLALHARHPSPWPWLPGGPPDLVGARLEPVVVSVLRDINPTIEIYVREPAGHDAPAGDAHAQTPDDHRR